jgi:flagellar export protein FliJ
MAPKFSLQPVLDYRHNRVELLEVELGQLLNAQQHGLASLDGLKESQAVLYQELHSQQVGDVDLFKVGQLRANLNTVRDRIVRQRAYLDVLAQQIHAKRSEVVGARQDEEALAILKNREIERYQVEQAQQELRLQDDIYIAQAFRRSLEL